MSPVRLLQRIAVCHNADPSAFEPWSVDGAVVGRVHRQRVARLLAVPSPFRRVDGRLELSAADPASRSRAVAEWLPGLVADGEIRALTGELYAAGAADGSAPRLAVDRAAVAWLGVRAAGVHLNGYVRGDDGLQLWVARRARDKRTFPGHLDNLVAGGQAFGLSASATLHKEAHEEAGLPGALLAPARAVGSLHYVQQDGLSWKPDTLALYDVELPRDFVPRPVDGEVESFQCWSLPQVVQSLLDDEPWKPNCALVAIDFLLRHGGLDRELGGADRWRLWTALHGQVA